MVRNNYYGSIVASDSEKPNGTKPKRLSCSQYTYCRTKLKYNLTPCIIILSKRQPISI